MGQLESRHLGLTGLIARQRQLFEEPVVQRAVTVEFERAERVRGALDGVALAMRPVVGGIDHPGVVCAVMMTASNAVHDRVAQLHVLVLHVDLGSQHVRPIGELAGPHSTEQVEALRCRSVAMWRLDTGLAVAAALGADRVAVLVVDVRLAVVDQQLGPVVQLLEVVAGVQGLARVVTQPAQVGQDALDERHLLGVGVGVVESQLADTTELAGQFEIERDRLGMADVEIAIRLGWEAGLDPPAEGALLDVALHQLANEIGTRRTFVIRRCHSALQYGG